MVQKTAEQISDLEKENAEMKKRLSFIEQNGKLSDLVSSAVWTVILWGLVSIIVDIAEYGSRAMAIEDNMSLLGAALLTSIVIIIGIILKAYVLYLFVVSTIYMFQSELNRGGVKTGIFLKAAWNAGMIAGRQALREAKTKENEHAEQELPTGETGQPKRDFQKTLVKGTGKKESGGATPAEEVKGKDDQKPPA